jgi:hypothetical protein
VGDANDNRPKFLLAEYRANIHANYSVGQPFLKVLILNWFHFSIVLFLKRHYLTNAIFEFQVQAIDIDVDNNAKISYSIYESNGTRASDTFDINPSTGELFLKQNALSLGMFCKFLRLSFGR